MLSGKKNISVLFLVLTLQNDGQVKVLVNSSRLCLVLRLSGLVPTTTFARVWSINSSTGSWSFSTSEPQPTQGTTDTPTSWGSSTNTLTKSGHSKADPIFSILFANLVIDSWKQDANFDFVTVKLVLFPIILDWAGDQTWLWLGPLPPNVENAAFGQGAFAHQIRQRGSGHPAVWWTQLTGMATNSIFSVSFL